MNGRLPSEFDLIDLLCHLDACVSRPQTASSSHVSILAHSLVHGTVLCTPQSCLDVLAYGLLQWLIDIMGGGHYKPNYFTN